MNILVPIAFALASNGTGSAVAGPLSMSQAVKLAENRAFAVLLQQSAVEKQRQAVSQANAALGPTVKVNATYTRFDQSSSVNFGGNKVTVSPNESKVMQAILSFPVDITGNNHRLLHASEWGYQAEQESLKAVRSNIALQVKTDYLAILRANAQVRVAQDSVTSNSELVKTTQAQLTAGTAAKIDLLRAQAQLAQSQGDLISAQNALTMAKENLNSDLARPIETPFDVVDVAEPPTFDAAIPHLTKIAEANRPEVKSLQLTVDQLAAITKATEQSGLPSLNLALTGTQNIAVEGFGARLQTASASATLTVPIYDHGLTRSLVKQARQNEAQAQIKLSQEKLSISLELQQAVTNYSNAKSRFDVAETQYTAAKEALRLATLKQQQSEGVYLDVLNAETALTQAESGRVSAQYDLWQAIASLQHAIGSDTLPTPASTTASN